MRGQKGTSYRTIDGFLVGYSKDASGYCVAVYADRSLTVLASCWTQGNIEDALSEARYLIAKIRERALAKQGKP